MRRLLLPLLIIAVVVLLAVGLWLPFGRPREHQLTAGLSVAEALRGGSTAGYERALRPRPFTFPADHGPHLSFRTEWWYFTGNLGGRPGHGRTRTDTDNHGRAGRRFGFQLTFFRQALAPPPDAPGRTSAWATRQVYFAHLALTDAAADSDPGRFRSFERFRRGALSLAGAQARPFQVWLDDWQASGPAAGSFTPLHLQAADGGPDGIALDLFLDAGKPPALQGDRGLSRKGSGLGQASYYYSLTRLPARGTIRSGGTAYPVTGLAWMDHEWSTSVLSADQVGWDWFALQLADGRELMWYQLRRRDGSADPASSGSLIEQDGTVRPLAAADLSLQVRDHWTSPRTGARYPSRWRLRVPAQSLDLDLRPLLADQELAVAFRYWEGAIEISGVSAGTPLQGRGYVELTGYADRPRAPR
jgi:predicted secreted hydrolase